MTDIQFAIQLLKALTDRVVRIETRVTRLCHAAGIDPYQASNPRYPSDVNGNRESDHDRT